MQHSISMPDGVRGGLWSPEADREAARLIERGILDALACLSATLSTAPEAGFDEAISRGARFEISAALRVHELAGAAALRYARGLERAQLEMRIEQAIVNAAAALPDAQETPAPLLRRACG